MPRRGKSSMPSRPPRVVGDCSRTPGMPEVIRTVPPEILAIFIDPRRRSAETRGMGRGIASKPGER